MPLDVQKTMEQLTEMLKDANIPDKYGQAPYACQLGFYGSIGNALNAITEHEYGVNYHNLTPNYGGNQSWYMDLLVAIEAALADEKYELEQRRANHGSWTGRDNDRLFNVIRLLLEVGTRIDEVEQTIILID